MVSPIVYVWTLCRSPAFDQVAEPDAIDAGILGPLPPPPPPPVDLRHIDESTDTRAATMDTVTASLIEMEGAPVLPETLASATPILPETLPRAASHVGTPAPLPLIEVKAGPIPSASLMPATPVLTEAVPAPLSLPLTHAVPAVQTTPIPTVVPEVEALPVLLEPSLMPAALMPAPLPEAPAPSMMAASSIDTAAPLLPATPSLVEIEAAHVLSASHVPAVPILMEPLVEAATPAPLSPPFQTMPVMTEAASSHQPDAPLPLLALPEVEALPVQLEPPMMPAPLPEAPAPLMPAILPEADLLMPAPLQAALLPLAAPHVLPRSRLFNSAMGLVVRRAPVGIPAPPPAPLPLLPPAPAPGLLPLPAALPAPAPAPVPAAALPPPPAHAAAVEGGFRLFIGGIPWGWRHGDLRRIFCRYGVVHALVITRNRLSLGYGFLTIADEQEAARCIDEMHRQYFGKRQIAVRWGRP